MKDEVSLELKETDWLLMQDVLDGEARKCEMLGQTSRQELVEELAAKVRRQAHAAIGLRQRRREIRRPQGYIDRRLYENSVH